jgi:hypothetical protein
MATTRGFVERIEVGRGGLVTVGLVQDDASRSTYVVSDIDGDPERFNERLTKVAVLRDAMNRAEPVEIEHVQGKAGQEIERVARIGRDALDPPLSVDQVSGLVLQVTLSSRNAVQGAAETHDEARVVVMALDGSVTVLRLDLQAPERQVAVAFLATVQDARARGVPCRFLVHRPGEGDGDEILAVAVGDAVDGGGKQLRRVSGFVESLGPAPAPGGGAASAALAAARFTTAPELTEPDGGVDPAPFTPAELELYLAQGSLLYDLVEAGLRDGLRMRLGHLPLVHDRPDASNGDTPVGAAEPGGRDQASPLVRGRDDTQRPRALLVAAELLAPLGSAGRPVWLHVDRTMLDHGPDDPVCVDGLPSTSLRPSSLRDLRIPYPARWTGHGCFNPGVYRFQLRAPVGATLAVDGDELCLYAGGEDGDRVGYACVRGDRVVTVAFPSYTCDTEFDLDVYRIR